MKQIRFNSPTIIGTEAQFISEAITSGRLAGDNDFTEKCTKWFEDTLECKKALLTTSCTHALEMSAILIDIQPGDEVIMPSYTFVSTANAFVLRGAKIVFVDIRPDTMNIDETLIEQAITSKTKAIVPVHYAGVACEMDVIMDIASKHDLFVIEDAAQGMMSTYKGKPLGTIGHMGTYSFHETKNYTSGGEGGLLIINDEQFSERAEVIREKGTNRSQFFRGMVDKYSWVDVGSSYLPSELNAAFLWGQLQEADKVNTHRLEIWEKYKHAFQHLVTSSYIEIATIPEECSHNAHMFYIKVKNFDERTKLLNYLKENNILAVFHYIPLHSSIAGTQFGTFSNKDNYTTKESERLIRLPIYFGLDNQSIEYIIDVVNNYFKERITFAK